jgi:hypothetical protein
VVLLSTEELNGTFRKKTGFKAFPEFVCNS